jgi:hypothetical protein
VCVVSAPALSEAELNYASRIILQHQRNWDALRAMLSADVKLKQSSHPLRAGPENVGMFFTIYAKSDSVRLVPE